MGVPRTALAVMSCAGVATALPVLGGYDMVAYWSLPRSSEGPAAQGVMGTAAHAVNISTVDVSAGAPKSLGDYEFWFANEANKEKFAADPWKYSPKYGGF